MADNNQIDAKKVMDALARSVGFSHIKLDLCNRNCSIVLTHGNKHWQLYDYSYICLMYVETNDLVRYHVHLPNNLGEDYYHHFILDDLVKCATKCNIVISTRFYSDPKTLIFKGECLEAMLIRLDLDGWMIF